MDEKRGSPNQPFTKLLDFAATRSAGGADSAAVAATIHRCELCGSPVGERHEHVMDPSTRKLNCSCTACALLFPRRGGTRLQRVPRRVRQVPELAMSDTEWESLLLPINLAFFFHSTAAGRVMAIYPSAAGPMESLLPLQAWSDLVRSNEALRNLEPDVEALLINRLGQTREYYCLPIDECYRLVGILRAHWRGFSGGTEVWKAVSRFFSELRRRANGEEAA